MRDGKVVIVVGDRMGKGKKVVAGIEEAGGIGIHIPGMAADMKVGDVMHEEEADLGISFCGSGGAGALMAENAYGYKSEHHLRTIDAGITALKSGAKVLGFGFIDNVEIGRRITRALIELINLEKGS
ncbi:MAG: SFCGS family glycine-rich protein [Chloroflexota bacterium]|nr:SFCGS family glycine-rich protein [Chloroflexota bacterium]